MIYIEYTNDSVENEPGPNLYWQGGPSDFLKLLNGLHILGKTPNTIIDLAKFDYILLQEGFQCTLQSSPTGVSLCEIREKIIEINLPCDLWIDILSFTLQITYQPGHVYVEFDNLDLIEDANIIMSSEWSAKYA